jgi:predicted amidohydrolase
VARNLVSQCCAGAPESPEIANQRMPATRTKTPDEFTVLAAVDDAVAAHRKADIFVLSEYCFHGQVPPEVLTWCLRHEKYVVAGGKVPLDPEPQYFNAVFVINPKGKLEFQQTKSVPIQFFNDGLPARARPEGCPSTGISRCRQWSRSEHCSPIWQFVICKIGIARRRR